MKKINLKQMSQKLFAVLAIIGATTFIAVAQDNNSTTEKTIAAGRCGENTLRGGYGTHLSGTFFVSPTMPVPLASVGRLVFDGAGNFSGSDTNSFGGTVSTYPVSGTYTVERDCTGTLNVNLPGFTITNNIVIVDEGKEIFVIQTNPGTVVTGTMKRQ